MILVRERLDYSKPRDPRKDVFIFTANSYLKTNGALVMGAGAAKAVRDIYRGIDIRLGVKIKNKCGHLGEYYFLWDRSTEYLIGALQVKHSYADKADMSLVLKSLDTLNRLGRDRPNINFHCNFPAIGNGGLAYEDILPVLELMSDNIYIYM